MTLSPEPEEQKVAQKSRRPTTSKYTGSFQNPTAADTATEEKAKKQKKAKERKQKDSRSITLGTEADPSKDPKNEKKRRRKKGKEKVVMSRSRKKQKSMSPKRIEPSNMERTGTCAPSTRDPTLSVISPL
jgi:hypothetical protein